MSSTESAPLVGASLPAAVRRFFAKYVRLRGRASRSEFWFAALGVLIGLLVPYVGFMVTMSITQAANGGQPVLSEQMPVIAWVFLGLLIAVSIASIIPLITITVRRLHDANFSGALYFLIAVPGFGPLIVLVLMCLPSDPRGARFD